MSRLQVASSYGAPAPPSMKVGLPRDQAYTVDLANL